MSGHGITKSDEGWRVKVVSTHKSSGTVVTTEGPIDFVDAGQGLHFPGNHYALGTVLDGSGGDAGWTAAVERIRPAVPTGLGAVVRLDMEDGATAVLVDPQSNTPWHITPLGRFVPPGDVASRIVAVLSEGVTP